MDFLDKLVILQSGDNLNLIFYTLVLAYIILIPFLGIVSGASLLSIYFNRKGRKNGNKFYLKFSKDLITNALFSKSAIFTFGFVPILSIMFSYIQLFHQLNNSISAWTFIALLVNLIALILLYIYKYTFQLEEIIRLVETTDDVEIFKKRNFTLHKKSGLWGIIFLFASVLILIGCIEFTYGRIYLDPNENLFLSIFSVSVINKFLLFVALSFALASAGALFYSDKKLKENDQPENEYSKFIERFSLTSGIISVLALPLFVLIHLLNLPQLSLSGTVFSISLIIILLLLLSAHFYYLMIKEKHKLYINHVLYIVVITSVLLVVQDVNGFKTSSQKQVVTLSAKFDKMLAGIAEKSGKGPKIDGKEIYDGRCAACHRFDQKLVGPAYKDVLPKYESKKNELIDFIVNPVKVNPLFPPMPNQGLNVKQAEAVAEYILNTYKEK